MHVARRGARQDERREAIREARNPDGEREQLVVGRTSANLALFSGMICAAHRTSSWFHGPHSISPVIVELAPSRRCCTPSGEITYYLRHLSNVFSNQGANFTIGCTDAPHRGRLGPIQDYEAQGRPIVVAHARRYRLLNILCRNGQIPARFRLIARPTCSRSYRGG
jgi:hypothetical protein